MSSRKMVYGVSRGSYSDYRIIAVFSTREKAQAFIDAGNSNFIGYDQPNSDIEEYELDVPLRDVYTIKVSMDRNGVVEDADELQINFASYVPGFDGIWVWKDGKSEFRWTVATKDRKRAIKVANEKRTQIIALGLWPAEDASQETLWELNEQIKERVK